MQDEPKVEHEELDLNKLDNPDAPKPVEQPQVVQQEMPPAQPVIGRPRHPYRKYVITLIVLTAAVLVAAYWFNSNKVVAPTTTGQTVSPR